MVPLGDEAQLEARFGSFGDSANLDAKLVLVHLEIVLILTLGARFVAKVPYARKSFWTHPMELLSDVGPMESCFSQFGDGVSVGAR
jgi:hypothetical protein